jgi:Na+/H+ antiporter NhaC
MYVYKLKIENCLIVSNIVRELADGVNSTGQAFVGFLAAVVAGSR